MSNQHLAITRVANACVVVELDGHTVLTDPWFTERWYLRRGEPLGMTVAELPPLTAIVATSFAVNHWDFRRHGVRHALLALLSEGPKYGLQLRQEFESRTGEVWPLNVGQVYTTLQRLERDGFVESDGSDGPQKVFSITPEGAEELAAWLRTPPDVVPPPRDELVIKVLVATRVPGVDIPDEAAVTGRALPRRALLLCGALAGVKWRDRAVEPVIREALLRVTPGATLLRAYTGTGLRRPTLAGPRPTGPCPPSPSTHTHRNRRNAFAPRQMRSSKLPKPIR
jgi:DNA-binding PadR family transcriptional regulator